MKLLRHLLLPVAAIIPVLLATTPLRAQRETIGHQYTVLEIVGIGSASVANASGGYPAAVTVLATDSGSHTYQAKQAGAAQIDPVRLDLPAGELTNWLKLSLEGDPPHAGGRLVHLGGEPGSESIREFDGARITQIRFPELDSTRRQNAVIGLTIQPSNVHDGSTPLLNPPSTSKFGAQTSNFRVTIPSVDCGKVSKLSSIVVDYKQPQHAAGHDGLKLAMIAVGEHGNVVLTLPASKAADFRQWLQSFLLTGDGTDRRPITIEILSANAKQVMLTLEGHQAGILAYRPQPLPAGSTATRMVEVELFVNRWELK